MWEFFIRNEKFAYLFLVSLMAVGVYTLLNIPRESTPEVTIPVGIVTTTLPGAPATDIETLVTSEIERGLTGLDNVKEITSTSRQGVSSVTVTFEAAANVDDSIQELKDEIDRIKVSLPADAKDPAVQQIDFQDQPIMTIAVAGDRADRGFVEVAESVEEQIEAIANVSDVRSAGVRKPEIQVIVEQAALQQYGVPLTAITAAIAANNSTLPIGQIKNDGVIYNVAFEGKINTLEEIKNVSIATRGGQPVFVRDVATVIDGLTPVRTLSRFSQANQPSQPAVTFDVYKQSGGDITKIARAVNARLVELQDEGELLENFTVDTVLDSGEYIERDLVQLSTSGLQTIALVVLLLVVAIGWREGLLAGTAIPLSFLFGFIGLYFSGNSINFLSLFSLILGIGILVDSAIVMVEGINRRMKDDLTINKKQAAIDTIHEFATPLIAGTLTTVSMFVGLFIVSGIIGQFIASIPFTLIFLLFASLFVALAIIPLFAASFLKRRSATVFERRQTEYAHKLETWYRSKLDWLLGNTMRERRFMWLLRLALFLAILLPIAGAIPVIFFEQTDVDYVIVEIEEPAGTTKEVTDVVTRRVEDILYTEPDIEAFSTTVGSGNAYSGGGTGEKLANIFVLLSDNRDRNSTEITDDLRAKLAVIDDSSVTVTQPSDGPPTGSAVVIKLLGDDLNQLNKVANEAALLVKNLDYTTNVTTSTHNNSTEFVLTLNRTEAARLGLDPRTISQLARTAVFGTEAASLTTLSDDVKVIVKLNLNPTTTVSPDDTNQATIEALTQINIPTPTGESVLLGSIVDVSLRESSNVINHDDQQRVVTIQSDVTSEGNARAVQKAAVSAITANLDLTGITLSTGGGETEESNDAFIEMALALVVGVLLMIAVLTLQFNSYLHTRYVLTILPYSLIGIFFGLAVTNSPLSFPSMMGFIALSGIVVNNSILLIDVMNNQRRRNPQKPIREVVLDAASSRLRPILLTTLTTVIGMIPLALAGDLWAPLAFAVMFGLIFSVVITLILIPVIYHRNPGAVSR